MVKIENTNKTIYDRYFSFYISKLITDEEKKCKEIKCSSKQWIAGIYLMYAKFFTPEFIFFIALLDRENNLIITLNIENLIINKI